MWKWLGGCLVVVVVLIVVGFWWTYQTMQGSLAPDGSARIAIAASPARVFASLAHGDSVTTWMAQGNRVTTTRRGPLVPGDTLRVEMRSTAGMPSQRMSWHVREVVPDRLIVLQLVSDSAQRIVGIRRDSLVAAGDSTIVVSTLTSPTSDSRGTPPAGAKGKRDGLLRLGSDLMLAMLTMQSKLDLDGLKARIEKR